VDGKCGDADAGGEQEGFLENRQLRQHGQSGDTVSETLGGAERPFHRSIGKDECKFFSPITSRKIAGSCDAPSGTLLAVQQPAQFTEDLVAHRMTILIIDLFEVVEVHEEQRERTHGAEGQGTEVSQRFLEVGVIIEAGQAVPDGLVAQQLIGLHKVSVGVGQFLDESFGFHLLAFNGGNVSDRFDDVRLAGRRLYLRPLHEEVLIVREGHLAGGRLSRVDGFRHLAERTRRRAVGDLFVASEIGDVAELILGHLVLKDNLMGGRVDDRDDDRL